MDKGFNGNTHSFSAVIREVREGFGNVIKSDLDLAKVELRDTGGHVKRDGMQVAVFAVVAALGVPPFLAFLVIGLGAILGGNYWLSALLVSLVFFAVGGGMAYAGIKKLKKQDLTLPHTRRALEQEINSIKRKARQISERVSENGAGAGTIHDKSKGKAA